MLRKEKGELNTELTHYSNAQVNIFKKLYFAYKKRLISGRKRILETDLENEVKRPLKSYPSRIAFFSILVFLPQYGQKQEDSLICFPQFLQNIIYNLLPQCSQNFWPSSIGTLHDQQKPLSSSLVGVAFSSSVARSLLRLSKSLSVALSITPFF